MTLSRLKLPSFICAALLAVSPNGLADSSLKPARLYYSYHEFGGAINVFNQIKDRYHIMCYRLDGEAMRVINPADFEKYSTVCIIGNSFQMPPLQGETLDRLEKYIRRGGNLVLVGSAIKYFNGDALLRIAGLAPLSGEHAMPCEITASAHPLLAGLGKVSLSVTPIADGVVGATPLISVQSHYIAAADYKLGKGHVIALSVELFPPFGTGREMVTASGKVAPYLGRFTSNLLEYLNIPKLETAIRELSGNGETKGILNVWYRLPDHEVFSGARRMTPPVPRDSSEFLLSLGRKVGLRDSELIPFYLTYSDVPGPISIRIKGDDEAAQTLNSHLQLLEQGSATSDGAGPEVYFTEHFRQSEQYTIAADRVADSLTLLFQLKSGGLKPGTYRCQIEISKGPLTRTLPLEIQVTDVALPDYPLHHVNLESAVLGGLFWETPAKLRAERLAVALKSITDAGSDHMMGSLFRYIHPTILGENLQASALFSPDNRERFVTGDLPPLDFSAANELMDPAAQAGLIIFRNYPFLGAENYLPQLAGLFGKKDLTYADPEKVVFLKWYLGEIRRYLREKGYAMAYLKVGDEWGPGKVDEYTEIARILQSAGWKVIMNPNGQTVLSVPSYQKKVLDVSDTLMMTIVGSESYLEAAREIGNERHLIPPDGLFPYLSSSWWWNQVETAGFAWGYAMANAGVTGAHLHGWYRGMKDQAYEGVHLSWEPFEIKPSMGLAYFGKGIQDGEYLTFAHQIIRYGTKQGLDMSRFQRRLDSIVGDPGAILPLSEPQADDSNAFDFNLYVPKRDLTLADYQKAKEALLDLLVDMKQKIGPLPSALRWGDRILWNPDKPMPLAIYSTDVTRGAASTFASLLKRKSEVPPLIGEFPFQGKAPPEAAGQTFLLIDNSDPTLCEAVSKLYPGIRLRPSYPAPGSYAIFEPPHSNILVVAGNGSKGVDLAAEVFPKFIEGTLDWKKTPVPGVSQWHSTVSLSGKD